MAVEIKNKNSGAIKILPDNAWEKMKQEGLHRTWKVINRIPDDEPAPAEIDEKKVKRIVVSSETIPAAKPRRGKEAK